MTAPSTLVGPPDLDQGDPVVAHIVKKDGIAGAYIEGTPLEALCGKVFVPSRDPRRVPRCTPCEEIARASFGDDAERIGT